MTETNTPSDSVSQPTPPIVPSSEEIDPIFQPYLDAFNIKQITVGQIALHTVTCSFPFLFKKISPGTNEADLRTLLQIAEDADSRLEAYRMDDGDSQTLHEATRLNFQEKFDIAKAELKVHGIEYDLYKRAKQTKQAEAAKINRRLNPDLYS